MLCTIMSTRMLFGGDGLEDAGRDARLIGHVEQRDLGLLFVERDAVDREVFHSLEAGDDVDGVEPLVDGGVFAERHAIAGALSSSNSVWTARRAASALSRVTRTETLISLVVIASRLILSSASTRNMRSATPLWVAMPRPTIETFETLASCETRFGLELFAGLFDGGEGFGEIVFEDGERDIGPAVGADVLDDHVDGDVEVGQLGENGQACAGVVGDADDRDLGFVLGEGGAAHGAVGRFGDRCR